MAKKRDITLEIGEAEIAELRRLEVPVRTSDGDGVRARWDSGRYMLTLKKGKQLPRGVLGRLAEKLDVHRSELGARMKFAEKYPTEEEVSTTIETFHSWSAIKERGLADKPRVDATDKRTDEEDDEDAQELQDDLDEDDSDHRRALKRVLAVVEGIDSATLDDDDLELLALIANRIHRLQDAVMTLRDEVTGSGAITIKPVPPSQRLGAKAMTSEVTP